MSARTKHVLPGYGDPVRRSKSAFPFERDERDKPSSANSLVRRAELDRIQEEARRMWTPILRENTTYGDHFREKSLQVKSTSRPTSPTRRNNPHPQPVFLVNRLHYIPGYHNPDTTMGKPTYKIDASVPPHLQALRREPREKYKARPSTSSVNQYRPKYNFRDFLGPTDAQAMEAWMKLADDKDKDKVLTMFSDEIPSDQRNMDTIESRFHATSPSATHPLASLHRYLQPAGVSEANELSRVMDTIRSNPARQSNHNYYSQFLPDMTVSQLREADIDATARVSFKRKPARGDFLIHPEWPPYMTHHRIPGF